MAKKMGRGKTGAASKRVRKKSSPKRLPKSPSLSMATDQVWPVERDVLYRPDRFKYVRKLVKPDGCVFCAASVAPLSFDRLCVLQTELSMVVVNKYPYNSGHLMVLPRRHCGDLLELDAEEYADLMSTLRRAFKAVQELYHPAGINMGLNHGAVAGAGIPDHLHFHLIPRWAGDLNFFPLIAETKVVIETLEQTWERFYSHFLAEEEASV